MRVGSLFTGIGGFDLGLERVGCEIAWQVEKDPRCREVLRRHWPGVTIHEDVHDVGRSNLAPVDLICGGFPCQDLSVAGRRAGLAGARSGLFHEFMRVVAELAPAWVLIENVPGLLSSHGGRDMATVVGTLADLGYGWTYRVLDTQYFGPPQRRERVFIVGRAGGFCPPEVLLEPESVPWHPAPLRAPRQGAARGVAGGVGGEGECGYAVTCHSAKGVAHTLRAEGCDASEDGTGRGVPIVAQTITAAMYQGGGATAGNNPGVRNVVTAFDTTKPAPRRLTPRECERLQDFPDDWTASGVDEDGQARPIADTPRYRMPGNAVSVPVAEWIGRRLVTIARDAAWRSA